MQLRGTGVVIMEVVVMRLTLLREQLVWLIDIKLLGVLDLVMYAIIGLEVPTCDVVCLCLLCNSSYVCYPYCDSDTLRQQLSSSQTEVAELSAALTDYARRLEEVQSELVLQKAQKRIDDREMSRMQRECGNVCLAARGEVAESRMMQRHYL